MGLRGTPRKSIFLVSKWHFPDFLFRGSVEGRGVANKAISALAVILVRGRPYCGSSLHVILRSIYRGLMLVEGYLLSIAWEARRSGDHGLLSGWGVECLAPIGEGILHNSNIRVGFWQNGSFADSYFWAAGFFSRILSPDFFASFL